MCFVLGQNIILAVRYAVSANVDRNVQKNQCASRYNDRNAAKI